MVAKALPQLNCRLPQNFLIELCLSVAHLDAKADVGTYVKLALESDSSAEALRDLFCR